MNNILIIEDESSVSEILKDIRYSAVKMDLMALNYLEKTILSLLY